LNVLAETSGFLHDDFTVRREDDGRLDETVLGEPTVSHTRKMTESLTNEMLFLQILHQQHINWLIFFEFWVFTLVALPTGESDPVKGLCGGENGS
jgi:hypothetical protein